MTMMREFFCVDCEHVFEYLFHNEEVTDSRECPVCGGHAPIRCTSSGIQTVVMGNADFGARQRERLIKRSDDHWNRKGRDEARQRLREKDLP